MAQLWPLILAHDPAPEVRTMAKATLDHWFAKGGRCDRSGWPGFFMILGQLYLGDRKGVAESIDLFIKNMLKPNGLMPHMPLAIDKAGPRYRELAATTPENDTALVMILTQTLLQSHNGLIRVFPGRVGGQTARFGALRAEGAFLVSAEMQRGRVTFVAIHAERGGTVRVANPWKRGPVRVLGRKRPSRLIAGAVVAVDMRPGETITLVRGRPPALRRLVSVRCPCVKSKRYPDGIVVTLGKPLERDAGTFAT